MTIISKYRVWHNGEIFGYERLTVENGWEWMCPFLNPDKGERWSRGVITDGAFTRDRFTGLLDCKGNEIYERDRAKRRLWLTEDDKQYMDYHFDVKWVKWCFGLFIADKFVSSLDGIISRELEVISNTELLKQ
jgi:hypothetical protein